MAGATCMIPNERRATTRKRAGRLDVLVAGRAQRAVQLLQQWADAIEQVPAGLGGGHGPGGAVEQPGLHRRFQLLHLPRRGGGGQAEGTAGGRDAAALNDLLEQPQGRQHVHRYRNPVDSQGIAATRITAASSAPR